MTTPTASPMIPKLGARNTAARMIARLYTIGAIADAANRPRALSRLVASAPQASRIGLSSITRVSSIVRWIWAGVKWPVITGTRTGAAMATITARISRTASISVATVDATRHARASSSVASRPATIGIRAELRAPAATSWKMKSGIRKAARNASRSALAPNVAPITIRRTEPRMRDTRKALVTINPARAIPHEAVIRWRSVRLAGARVSRFVRCPEATRRDVSVDLGRGQALMAEQLLDHTEVGPTIEQMGGEAVPERVRRDTQGQARPDPETLQAEAQAAYAEWPAAMVQEDLGGRLALRQRSSEERWAAIRQVGLEGRPGRLSEQPDALLAALAEHPDLAAPEVERPEAGRGQLADPEARGIGGLDDRPVTQCQGISQAVGLRWTDRGCYERRARSPVDRREEPFDILALEDAGQSPGHPGRRNRRPRVAFGPAVAGREPVERTQGSEPLADRAAGNAIAKSGQI